MGVDLLYWNIDGGSEEQVLKPRVAAHIAKESPSILILSEAPAVPIDVLAGHLSTRLGYDVESISTPNPTRNPVFVRCDTDISVHGYRGAHEGRVGFYKVRDGRHEILLVALHLKEARNHSVGSRRSLAGFVAQTIREVEGSCGHSRTLVVGDFNMNPYDIGMTAADGFNAVSDRIVGHRESRTFHGRTYPFFFNPSWSLLGDCPRPPGSYCLGPGDGTSPYWSLVDQVLVRVDLLQAYRLDATIQADPDLTTRENRPSRAHASDHFPLRVELENRT